MTFEEYQKISRKTAVYKDADNNYIYPTLGLVGEAGEVAEKIKRVVRGENDGKITEDVRADVAKELGDVIWYVSQLATELGISLEEVVAKNIEKLQSRQERGVLHSKGDNR